jgi:hypothetical protein
MYHRNVSPARPTVTSGVTFLTDTSPAASKRQSLLILPTSPNRFKTHTISTSSARKRFQGLSACRSHGAVVTQSMAHLMAHPCRTLCRTWVRRSDLPPKEALACSWGAHLFSSAGEPVSGRPPRSANRAFILTAVLGVSEVATGSPFAPSVRFMGIGCPLWPWCHSGGRTTPISGRQLGRPPSRLWAKERNRSRGRALRASMCRG